MTNLSDLKCIACRGGDPPASQTEREMFFPQIPGWETSHIDGSERLAKTFAFKKYPRALAFSKQVGEWAEEQDHHPSILIEWGKVTVTWWTHILDELHRNDFISAAKTDKIYLESS